MPNLLFLYSFGWITALNMFAFYQQMAFIWVYTPVNNESITTVVDNYFKNRLNAINQLFIDCDYSS